MTLRAVLTVLILALAATTSAAQERPEGYHDASAMHRRMRSLAAARPELFTFLELGRSTEGRSIEALLLHDREGPAPEDKPGLVVIGNLAGDEAAGGEATLRIAEFVAAATETDAAFRGLLRSRAIWLIPRPNPDATERLFRGLPRRESLEPWDSDGDGLADEDAAEDLDGDGRVGWMRVPDAGGEWLEDADLPGLLRRRRASKGELGGYRWLLEGRDSDRDGRVNEDLAGGTDLDRNFPIHYKLRKDAPGAGAFPLSAPEARALARFLSEQPSISLVIHSHCNAHGALTAGVDRIPEADERVYAQLQRLFKESTGLDRDPLGAFVTPDGERASGTLQDFVAHGLGAFAWPARLWMEPPGADLSQESDRGFGAVEAARRRWFRFAQARERWRPWRRVEHPTLGSVELAELQPFTVETPPSEDLSKACEPLIRFALNAATILPQVELRLERVVSLADELTEVRVLVRNRGRLPTQPARAVELRKAAPTVLRAEITGGARIELGEARDVLPELEGGAELERRFVIAGTRAGVLRLTLRSPKGGVSRLDIELDKGM